MSDIKVTKHHDSIPKNVSKSDSHINGDPDFFHGSSKFKYPNGDVYEGEFCAHISGLIWKEGKGTYRTKDGQSYTGNWYSDKLLEKEPVEIQFPNGFVYEGYLEKYQFNGAACMRIPGDLKLILEFVENKPMDEMILLDHTGRAWLSSRDDSDCIFLQENIFFQNIPPTRGLGQYRIKKKRKLSKFTSTQSDLQRNQMTEYEKERVFQKSTKLREDYDFENSDWYRNYIEFKKKQQIVMAKVKKGHRAQLTKEEFEWYANYLKFKERYNSIMTKRRLRPKDQIDHSLLHTFCSEQYQNSKPTYVIYPSETSGN